MTYKLTLSIAKGSYQFYTQDDSIHPQLADEIVPQVEEQIKKPENKDVAIVTQLVTQLESHPVFQIPWGHHTEIFAKCKTIPEALFYVQKTIENGWSRSTLIKFIQSDLYTNVLAQYALESSSHPIGISAYDLAGMLPENYKSELPSIEEIENELKDIQC